MKISLKKNQGITLVALVITIVVLLILAAVAIMSLSGENNIITKAQTSKEDYEKASENEIETLDSYFPNEWRKRGLTTPYIEYGATYDTNDPYIIKGHFAVTFNLDGSFNNIDASTVQSLIDAKKNNDPQHGMYVTITSDTITIEVIDHPEQSSVYTFKEDGIHLNSPGGNSKDDIILVKQN